MRRSNTVIWRVVPLLLALAVVTSSLSLTSARYVTRNIASSNAFGVYHLLPAYTYESRAWGSANNLLTVKCANAPAGEWAFFARGQHGRDQEKTGKPGVLLGIYRKTAAGYFTIGSKTGGERKKNGGSGGLAAFIFDNMAFPTSNPGNTNGFVAVAGGGGGRGGDNDFRGGDAGGQTGAANGWAYVNGAPTPSPDYPTYSEAGFMGGFAGNNNNTSTQKQTTDAQGASGGGGGAGVTGDRAKGGGYTGDGGGNATWFAGRDGTGLYSTGGGGNGVWGGGGGASQNITGRAGGGGSSYSGAIAAVPARVSNPTTYKEFAINYFWDLVGTKHTAAGRIDNNNYTGDGTIILVWLGP